MLQASFTIPFGSLELRWIIALWTVSLLSSQSSLPSSLAAETLAGWNFHLLPSLVCTNLPAPSHTGHMSPKHQDVHKPRPFIFLDVKLFPPCFKTQIKCQLLCETCPLPIQTCPLFLVPPYNLLRNITCTLNYVSLKWLSVTQISR